MRLYQYKPPKYPWWLHVKKRLGVKFEWRDLWLGIFIGEGTLFICLIPCFPIYWRINWLGPRCWTCNGRGGYYMVNVQTMITCITCKGRGW
jgi:hypothetical protein